jgi:hypothetical protein
MTIGDDNHCVFNSLAISRARGTMVGNEGQRAKGKGQRAKGKGRTGKGRRGRAAEGVIGLPIPDLTLFEI